MLDDPLHDIRLNHVRWSRVNMAEAIPGVPTPLDWTFWARGFSECSRLLFRRLGVMTAAEASRPASSIEEEFVSAFWGRPVVNVDRLRAMAARVPGGDPDAVELQLLGAVDPDAAPAPEGRRWATLARAPVAVVRVAGELRTLRAETDAWWRVEADPRRYPAADAAAAGLAAAYERFRHVNARHGLNLFVGQAAYDQVAKLAASAGLPGLELELTAGAVASEESAMVADIRAAGAGALTVDDVVGRHGYHGPDEGVLSGRPWREDRGPLLALIARAQDGRRSDGRAAAARADAERRLLQALSPAQRVGARAALRFADRHLPLREVGKAAFLQAIDVARAAARALGHHLADEHILDDADDVFFLTFDEATGASPRVDGRELTARRARHRDYLGLDVPDTFTGTPEPRSALVAEASRHGTVVGLAGSPGVVEATARVIADAGAFDHLEPGDVLVCSVTDPGWAPLFDLAGAVVIDVGGVLSHGAIVARDMGIPCVIGTGDGTRRIRSGDRVRVDGSAGTVELL